MSGLHQGEGSHYTAFPPEDQALHPRANRWMNACCLGTPRRHSSWKCTLRGAGADHVAWKALGCSDLQPNPGTCWGQAKQNPPSSRIRAHRDPQQHADGGATGRTHFLRLISDNQKEKDTAVSRDTKPAPHPRQLHLCLDLGLNNTYFLNSISSLL